MLSSSQRRAGPSPTGGRPFVCVQTARSPSLPPAGGPSTNSWSAATGTQMTPSARTLRIHVRRIKLSVFEVLEAGSPRQPRSSQQRHMPAPSCASVRSCSPGLTASAADPRGVPGWGHEMLSNGRVGFPGKSVVRRNDRRQTSAGRPRPASRRRHNRDRLVRSRQRAGSVTLATAHAVEAVSASPRQKRLTSGTTRLDQQRVATVVKYLPLVSFTAGVSEQ